ncbi:MAG: class I SAM-dependent methyltransferase [Amphiplicatus sp.]
MRVQSSSGDLIADRRYSYGQALAQAGDHAAAAELFAQAIERAPAWAPAFHALGRARLCCFDRAGAVAAFRDCLRLDPEDRLGASLDLARLDAAVTVDAAPAAYVAALFDAYAPDFENALVERLHYTAPTTIAAKVRAAAPAGAPHRFARALDLGCGPGLAGEALRLDIGYLEGVDLAEGMIAVARGKGVYDSLRQDDILAHLLGPGAPFDLILAADVFPYIGDLARIIAAMGAKLTPGGLAAFSVEKAGAEDWTLRESLRFAHSEDYLRRLAAQASLAVVTIEETVLRKDRGAEIVGLVAILKAEATAAAREQAALARVCAGERMASSK